MEFFEQRAGSNTLCKDLQQESEQTQLNWELESASPHSPGPVVAGEILARQITDPTYFNALTGYAKPSLFDDTSSRGASTNRLSHAEPDEVHQMGGDRVAGRPQKYVGFVELSVDELRSIVTDATGIHAGRRAFGVYDTARASDRSHADVCQLIGGKQEARSLRQQLYELAKGRLQRHPA